MCTKRAGHYKVLGKYGIISLMQKTIKPQKNYSSMENGFQLVMPLNCGVNIPEDDPVRLLNAVVERMDFGGIYAAYSREGRIEYSPKILTKICVYGYMRLIISSRKIEEACRENIHFMYLLEGQKAPDHNTIARFRSKHLASPEGQDLLRQVVELLIESGLLSLDAVFIDGTKIEANANKYSFVWKKGSEKKLAKLQETIHEKLPEMLEKAGVRFHVATKTELRHLKKLRKKLTAEIKEKNITMVHGKGQRKHPLQRIMEHVEAWLQKMKQYIYDLHVCGDRNSYSKTDHDATFMHMKEDHMRNGQLKPGYNVNTATCNEFIIGNYISSDRNDVHTLIPFSKQLCKTYTGYKISKEIVDSGYESEENYCWFEEEGRPELYVKPSNHDQQKKKKYRTDISRRENMSYNAEENTYTCANGKVLKETYEKHNKTKSGFQTTTSVYECDSCDQCPMKGNCIKAGGSKKPLEERHKVLYVCKRFQRQREAMEKKISSEEGKLLRVNRSIQAEGSFAYIKEDLNFRQFLLRGKEKVEAEWLLFSLALNILKLHHKIQNNRLGTGLIIPEAFPAAL